MNLKTKKSQETFTREQLYKKVWSRSIRSLASEYKISESNLKTICNDNGIPLPKMGYWSKVKYGKKVIKIDESYTTQVCCKCGLRKKRLLSERNIFCNCGNKMCDNSSRQCFE